jgi:hypothetical protein
MTCLKKCFACGYKSTHRQTDLKFFSSQESGTVCVVQCYFPKEIRPETQSNHTFGREGLLFLLGTVQNMLVCLEEER